jgi:hypothetical protein
MSIRPESVSEQPLAHGSSISPPRRQVVPHATSTPVPQNAAFNQMQQRKKLIDLLGSINQD